MKTFCRVALLAGLFASTAGFPMGIVEARTPTPTLTASATPAPTFTPSPDQFSTFQGPCWLDAHRCNGQTMSARIDGTVCVSFAISYVPPDADQPLFFLKVPSKEVTPGCGSEGATVQFFVGDQQVRQPSVWHAGTAQIRRFIAGYPFADFAGDLRIDRRLSNETLLPYIGGNVCGYGEFGQPPSPYPYPYGAVVFSTEQQPGCGVDGLQITFKLLDAQGNVIAVANQTATWHAWDGVSDPQQLDLTFGPANLITMPGTGDGDASGAPWARLPVALGLVGLAGAALGLALRRRARAR